MSGNLYRRNGTYWGRVQVTGRDVRRSLRTTDRKEAARRLKQFLAEVEAERWRGETRHSWKEAAGRWLVEFAPHNLDESTATRYQVSIGQLESILGHVFVDEIGPRTIASIVTEGRKRKATNATIRRDLTAVSSVLRCCVGWGWREDNPALAYDRRLISERREPITLPTMEAIRDLANKISGPFGAAVLFLALTGVRQAEGVFLERGQFDKRSGVLTLTRTKTRQPRAFTLSDEAVGTLSAQPTHITGRYFFWHGDGLPFLNFASRFALLAKTHGFKHRCHDLRHFYAVNFLREGGNIYTLQKRLGHDSIKTTEGYLRYLTPEEQAVAKGESAQNPAQKHVVSGGTGVA